MDSRAAAPAATAARQHGVAATWLFSLSMLVLLWTVSGAFAESLPEQSPGHSEAAAQGSTASLISSVDPLANMRVAAALTTAARAARPAIGIRSPQPKPLDNGHDVAATTADDDVKAVKPTVVFGAFGRSVGLSPITRRWQKATAELANDTASSRTFALDDPAYRAILEKARPKRRGLQIPKVNQLVNRLLTYREDTTLYGTGEYWASPAETLSHRAGDCEDFAILKYALLRDLGISDDDMRIVVLRDTAVRQFHAVLTVRHKGGWLVLDNRFSRVRFERDLPHYKPLYSVNAAGEWAHTREPGTPVQLAARLKAATR
ncbi:transglutaminase-like cysteine peptidase [Roseibium sp.]|uniref:transglutaminase-like cysteine peptidase n=1 Tax=Roseibium sp. TaxID=1936156 RepID=UPI003B5046CE